MEPVTRIFENELNRCGSNDFRLLRSRVTAESRPAESQHRFVARYRSFGQPAVTRRQSERAGNGGNPVRDASEEHESVSENGPPHCVHNHVFQQVHFVLKSQADAGGAIANAKKVFLHRVGHVPRHLVDTGKEWENRQCQSQSQPVRVWVNVGCQFGLVSQDRQSVRIHIVGKDTGNHVHCVCVLPTHPSGSQQVNRRHQTLGSHELFTQMGRIEKVAKN